MQFPRPLISFICFLTALLSAVGCGGSQRERDEIKWPPQVSTDQTEGTTIVPTLDTPIDGSSNVLWCATFQLAWDHACNDVVGEPIGLTGAEQVTSRLNSNTVREADLPPGSFYATAGMTDQGIVEQIHADMGKQFPNHELPPLESTPGQRAMIAYAYLNSRVKFTTPYEECQMNFTDAAGEKHRVDGFMLHDGPDYELHNKQLKQIKVLYQLPAEASEDSYSSELAEFALDLTADQAEDQVIVAVLPRGESLAATIARVNEQIASHASENYDPNFVRVPNVMTNLRHTFDELIGTDITITNAGELQGCYVAQAWQSIQFRLDKSGAVVISEAEIETPAAEALYYHIVERPFLVLMKRRNASQPYFAAWVENVELLED